MTFALDARTIKLREKVKHMDILCMQPSPFSLYLGSFRIVIISHSSVTPYLPIYINMHSFPPPHLRNVLLCFPINIYFLTCPAYTCTSRRNGHSRYSSTRDASLYLRSDPTCSNSYEPQATWLQVSPWQPHQHELWGLNCNTETLTQSLRQQISQSPFPLPSY